MRAIVRSCFVALAVLGSSAMFAQAGESAADPAGRWKGTWNSATSSHHGPLRAKIRSSGCDTYRARFSGRFFRVIPFTYAVPLSVAGTTEDGRTLLTGSRRLPFFGEFCCQAEVSVCEFCATYSAAKDHGHFEMQRK